MQNRISLGNLKEGETAVVRELSAGGSLRRRLQDIGLIKGTRVECIGISPMGDPAAYLIRGAVLPCAARMRLESSWTTWAGPASEDQIGS